MSSARSTRPKLRAAVAITVLAGSMFSYGCATASKPAGRRAELTLELSPVAVAVAPRDAWRRAEAYAQMHPGSQVMEGRGGSMLPLYEDRTILVVQNMAQSDLRRGMTVVFIGDSGRPVAHTLLERSPRGWVAMGCGNNGPDRTPVQYRNYIGTVIGAFAPTRDLADAAVSVPAGDVDRIARLD